MRALRQFAFVIAGIAAMSSAASAYYHWVFFPTSTAPFTAVPGKFDLAAQKDNKVNFFISTLGPSALMPGDSSTAIYSQIHRAAAVWNNVSTSSLRLAFGGFATIGTPQTAPGIDVVFDDNMPPGILAQTRVTFPASLSSLTAQGTTPAATFVPILRSKVQLRSNLAAAGTQQLSYSDSFFLTVAHEFGHAIGLQHSMTSATMSTAVTRATMKGAPLAADDVASVSLLYPATGYTASTGTISGTVTLSNGGVNMASVVALSASGAAIGTLTNPDGTYRIDGLTPGTYLIYVHPLPPAADGEASPANIIAPVDVAGNTYAANIGFDTSFFPGTKDWTKAAQILIGAGQFTSGVNFAVQARPRPVIYGMQTYGYINGAAVAEPPMTGGTLGNPLVFYATGITTNNQTAIAPGLNVSVIGSAASLRAGTLAYYTEGYLLTYIDAAAVSAPTPAALAVTLGNDLYVLPQAFTVEAVAPPAITQITPGTAADGSANLNVAGSNLSAASTITFDGAPAAIQSVNADGSLTVVPPPAPSAYAAVVEAINPEGQTSLQSVGTATAPVYSYGVANAATVAVQPALATAGTDLMLTITGVNTHFADGQTVIGLGASDITVRRVWVVSPNVIQLNVSVGAGAGVGPVSATVSTGLEIVTLPAAISILAPTAPQTSLLAPGISTLTGLPGVPIGGTVLLSTNGLPTNLAGWKLTIGGVSTNFGVNANGILTAAVPAGVSFGPAALQLTAPSGAGPSPILIQVDAPPPVITGAIDSSGAGGTGFSISAATPASAGDVITLVVTGLAGAAPTLPPAGAIWITVGSTTVPVFALGAASQNAVVVQFVLPAILANSLTTTTQLTAVTIGTGTRVSTPFFLTLVPVLPPAPSN
jgi:hypothetical protein